jgi:hypothetical protein
VTDVTVQYERKFSDGNYGSEGLSLSWTVTHEDTGDLAADPPVVDARCRAIGSALRAAVLSFLSTSEARNVAFAAQRELNPPPPRAPAGPAAPTESLEDLPF